ncbi:MAG TPA: hypothetical protein VFG54_08850 [Prolixibacteraceae bacterium]|nr:hypothetical protein [Prolixibacteraceae bacterium]
MKIKFPLTVLLMLFSVLLFAQQRYADRLLLIKGKSIVCEVREIGDDEIKYVLEGYRDDLLFGIDKNKVARIIFSDGREMELSDSMFGSENYDDQHKNAFKFHFFSPLTEATAISYERSLKPGSSLELGLGIIGLGSNDLSYDDSRDASGAYFKLGYKFIKSPDFYLKGMRYAHLLKGTYFKPEIALSAYNYIPNYARYWGGTGWETPNGVENKENVLMAAFILNVGKQWVFADRFLVDWHIGAGYGFGQNDSHTSRHFAFLGADGSAPLVLSSGFKVGLLF